MLSIPHSRKIKLSPWHDKDGRPWLFQKDFPMSDDISRWQNSNVWDDDNEFVYTIDVHLGIDDIVIVQNKLGARKRMRIVEMYPAKTGLRMAIIVQVETMDSS